jgi:hypothetical protein
MKHLPEYILKRFSSIKVHEEKESLNDPQSSDMYCKPGPAEELQQASFNTPTIRYRKEMGGEDHMGSNYSLSSSSKKAIFLIFF